MEVGLEQHEALKPSSELVDILSGKNKFHWTSIENLPRILSRGLYSPDFARRIKDKGYKVSHHLRFVYLTHLPKQLWAGVKGVALVVDVSQDSMVFARIAPRQFVGIMIVDEPRLAQRLRERVELRKSAVFKRVNQIVGLMSKTGDPGKVLPVYGTSGDLYWPQKMSHEEIVGMLKTKEEGVV